MYIAAISHVEYSTSKALSLECRSDDTPVFNMSSWSSVKLAYYAGIMLNASTYVPFMLKIMLA